MAKIKVVGKDFYAVVRDHAQVEQADSIDGVPQSVLDKDGNPIVVVFESALRVVYTSMLQLGAPVTATKGKIEAVTEGTYGVFGDDDTGYMPFRTTLSGNFKYGNLDTVKGKIESIDVSWNGETVMKITGLDVDAAEGWAALRSGDGSIDPSVAVGIRKDELSVLFGGNDKFIGGEGSDYFGPSPGKDKMLGNDGNDALRGGRGADVLKGGNGDDSLRGDEGDDRLFGQNGDDGLDGRFGDDRLDGGNGDDSLRGNSGDDTFKGGKGDDLLFSSDTDFISGVGERFVGGSDTFLFGKGDGNDTIEGYDPDTDTIRLGKGATQNNVTLTEVEVGTGSNARTDTVLAFADVTVTLTDTDAADVTFDIA